MSSEVDLGVAYEGPPGCVHGGVSSLLLDHLMGETASNRHTQLIVTGTLNLRYVHPLPLGRVRMEGRITGTSGRKVTVTAHIGPADSDVPAVEATGLFIIPRWANDESVDRLARLSASGMTPLMQDQIWTHQNDLRRNH